ncbi:hypothetical protein [Riemerella columbipharyngis]|uniref:Uncharacterized protein n=1 Tax=Riemerella columbipharyngis TaxID=1071918 RepID=A0A1G7FUL7_9FLAO|nr:hypothetical protein [Riemerella columbipharyngis]SDE79561.1 hypothetical protein SAMN05421544_1284 [Riemerella columbipharyngis]
MKELIELLSKDIQVHEAGTGSLYVEYKGKKVRVADHEPNHTMKRMRGYADLEIYTKDACNTTLKTEIDVVEDIADFFEIEITNETLLKKSEENLQYKIDQSKMTASFEETMAKIQNTREEKIANLKPFVIENLDKIKEIINEAEVYSDSASNGTKRRKKRRNYFFNKMKEVFSIEVELSDVNDVIKAI